MLFAEISTEEYGEIRFNEGQEVGHAEGHKEGWKECSKHERKHFLELLD